MQERRRKMSIEGSDQDILDDDNVERITEALMDDYIRKHKHILRKLEIAKEATSDALKEMEAMKKIFSNDQMTKMINEYEEAWQNNIQSYLKAGLTETDLENVEGMLLQIPAFIKEKYEEKLAKEPAFEASMSAEDKKRIYELIEKISHDFESAWSGVKAYKVSYDPNVVTLN